MPFEAQSVADSPVSRWYVIVPVADEDRRYGREHATGAHQGTSFTAAALHVNPGWRGEHALYRLSGPNVRQDGTEGALTLECYVTREYAEKNYPAALALAFANLAELAEQVSRNADEARAEIRRAIEGKTLND